MSPQFVNSMGEDTWTMFLLCLDLPEVVSKMLWELLFKSQLVYMQSVCINIFIGAQYTVLTSM